jgi:antitoxin component of MazEF toxin-antitoxin module
MPTLVKVRKWGNSLAVIIPTDYVKARNIQLGTLLDLESVRVMKPRRKRFKLSELVANTNPNTLMESGNFSLLPRTILKNLHQIHPHFRRDRVGRHRRDNSRPGCHRTKARGGDGHRRFHFLGFSLTAQIE